MAPSARQPAVVAPRGWTQCGSDGVTRVKTSLATFGFGARTGSPRSPPPCQPVAARRESSGGLRLPPAASVAAAHRASPFRAKPVFLALRHYRLLPPLPFTHALTTWRKRLAEGGTYEDFNRTSPGSCRRINTATNISVEGGGRGVVVFPSPALRRCRRRRAAGTQAPALEGGLAESASNDRRLWKLTWC